MRTDSLTDGKTVLPCVSTAVKVGCGFILSFLLIVGCDRGFEPVEPPPDEVPDQVPTGDPVPERDPYDPVPPPDFPDTPEEPHPIHPPDDPALESPPGD